VIPARSSRTHCTNAQLLATLRHAIEHLIPGIAKMAHVTRDFLRLILGGTFGKSESAQVSSHVISCLPCRRVARGVVLEMQTEIKAENPKSRMSGPMRALIEVFEGE